MKRKMLCLLLAMLCMVLSLSAFTLQDEQITVSVSSTVEDEYVDVVISLYENSGITTIDIHVGYDSDMLQRYDVIAGDTMLLPLSDPQGNPMSFLFDLDCPFGVTTETGDLVTIRFRLINNIDVLPVDIRVASAYIANIANFVYEAVDVTVINADADFNDDEDNPVSETGQDSPTTPNTVVSPGNSPGNTSPNSPITNPTPTPVPAQPAPSQRINPHTGQLTGNLHIIGLVCAIALALFGVVKIAKDKQRKQIAHNRYTARQTREDRIIK